MRDSLVAACVARGSSACSEGESKLIRHRLEVSKHLLLSTFHCAFHAPPISNELCCPSRDQSLLPLLTVRLQTSSAFGQQFKCKQPNRNLSKMSPMYGP